MLDFPNNPAVGESFPDPPVGGTPVWTWDGQKWRLTSSASGGVFVEEAPTDNQIYGRWMAQWRPVVEIGAAEPANPPDSSLWWDSSVEGGRLYIRYNDGDSTQWVPASPSIAGPPGPPGPQGDQGIPGPTGPQGIVDEAPNDGQLYVRRGDGLWIPFRGNGTAGYLQMPGGLLLQWGLVGWGGDTWVAFPVAFTAAVFSVQVTPISTAGLPAEQSLPYNVHGAALAQFYVQRRYANLGGGVGGASQDFYWFAVGI